MSDGRPRDAHDSSRGCRDRSTWCLLRSPYVRGHHARVRSSAQSCARRSRLVITSSIQTSRPLARRARAIGLRVRLLDSCGVTFASISCMEHVRVP
ncbi:MAG TPA: hypothetical protein VHB78_08565 [Vicinamibacterales bacterium]|nr:hypothetical protein [Vicinamibacterales bacterium]